jgi:F-type H+-transporting ATPase subunit c
MSKKLAVMFFLMTILMLATPVFAQGEPAAAAAGTNWVAITSGFSVAIAAGLAGIGEGLIAAAACEGIARNPAARTGIQTAMILGLAFVESLVLFTLMIVFVKVVK